MIQLEFLSVPLISDLVALSKFHSTLLMVVMIKERIEKTVKERQESTEREKVKVFCSPGSSDVTGSEASNTNIARGKRVFYKVVLQRAPHPQL